jgi:hypothetical protein
MSRLPVTSDLSASEPRHRAARTPIVTPTLRKTSEPPIAIEIVAGYLLTISLRTSWRLM